MLMWHARGQVKGEAEAVTDALKQLSALLRTHSQRKPQQVTVLAAPTLCRHRQAGDPCMLPANFPIPCHPVQISMHGTQSTRHFH